MARARLKGNLRPFLEFESGSNDPWRFLTIAPPSTVAPMGGGVQGLWGWRSKALFQNSLLDPCDLFLGMESMMTYGLTAILDQFIASILASSSTKSLIRFIGIAWLMKIVMFPRVTVFPQSSPRASHLSPILVARPPSYQVEHRLDEPRSSCDHPLVAAGDAALIFNMPRGHPSPGRPVARLGEEKRSSGRRWTQTPQANSSNGGWAAGLYILMRRRGGAENRHRDTLLLRRYTKGPPHFDSNN
ncbi:MAG: hypothetical protein RJR34_09900 [Candidatus Methanoculleus thermohydrogenotrophicum]|nr:hypothetical protein [Candidatus Methanoculleus thermohydrogenotrophicum]